MNRTLVLIAITILTNGLFAQNKKEMKSINKNAPVKSVKKISIDADSKTVWNLLTNINDWSEWQSDISLSELNGELKPDTTFDWKSGGVKIHSMLHTVKPANQIGWTGKTFGVFAIHNWILSEKNGKTTVEVEESMQGILANIFKKSFSKKLDSGLQLWLESLKQQSEIRN